MDNIQVTHNNDNHHYRIAMDIAKEGSSLWDLTPYVKGRVGDNRFGLQVTWTYQGQLMNVEGMKPYIEGNVGQYSVDDKNNLQLDPNSGVVRYVGDPADCQAGGQVTYYFPEQMFPKEGIFKGYIGLLDDRDDSQNPHISGVTVWFKVLPGIAEMGHACDYYISDLEKAEEIFKAKLRQHEADFQNEASQVISDARNSYTTEVSNAHDALLALVSQIQANRDEQANLTNRLAGTEQQIEIHDVVRLRDFNQKFDTLENKIDHDLENISPVPLSFANLDAAKAAYPTGTTALIVTDDGHRAVYRNGQWQDGGLYNSLGVANNSIGLEQLSDKSLDDTAPNLYSEDSPNLVKGGFHKSDGSFQNDVGWGEFSIGVQKGETIAWNQTTWFYTFWKDGKFVSGGTANNSNTVIVVPDNVDTLKIPVGVTDAVTDFNRNLFCIVRGENIPFDYPQNNVLNKFYVPLKNASHQLGYGRIVANGGNLNITKIDANYYLNFPSYAQVFYGSHLFNLKNDQNRVLLAGVGKKQGTWLYYNPISQLIESFTAQNESDSLINLGVIYDSSDPSAWCINTNLAITFNDKPFTSMRLDKKNLLPNTSSGQVSGTGQINVDLSNNTMQFDDLFVSNSMIANPIDNSSIDISKIKTGAWLYYNVSTQKVISSTIFDPSTDNIAIGAWWAPLSIDIYGNPNIYVDGVKYNPQQPLKGHKINVLGDSISYGINTSKSYVGDLKTVTGAETVRNYGLPSASIAQRAGKSWNWDTVDPLIVHYQEMDKDADVIFLFGGVNDWVAGRPLGKFGDTDITTFYGALDTLLANLRSQYVGATILEATPLQTDWTTRPAANGTSDGKNSQGLMLSDYVDAIKQVAGKYSVPVLDLYHGMFYPFNSDFKSKYMTDSLHPTRAGHLLLADKIGNFINANV